MIKITETFSINEDNFEFNFIRSSGPGGQNVNKVSTAVQLTYDVLNSNEIEEKLKYRILKLAGSKATNDGKIIIESHSFRTQLQNKKSVIEKFIGILKEASKKKKKRVRTKPTNESVEKRLESKKKKSSIKKDRSKIKYDS